MAGVYEEVEIEDMVWSEEDMAFKYPCPCGDTFFITMVRRRRRDGGARPLTRAQDALLDGEELADCPSCSLKIRVIYDMVRGGAIVRWLWW